MIGLCGGYTTLSSFSLQTLDLLRDGAIVRAAINIATSVALCITAVASGHLVAAHFNSGARQVSRRRRAQSNMRSPSPSFRLPRTSTTSSSTRPRSMRSWCTISRAALSWSISAMSCSSACSAALERARAPSPSQSRGLVSAAASVVAS
jgi:hypothetical protein